MPFRIIKGTFHVLGYSPDGDSIRFQANDETNWSRLDGPPVRLNARRHAQLRLEAIDTLETHFLTNLHQSLRLAIKALDFLLHELGITEVSWDPLHLRIVEAHDGTEGYIISREVEKNRRPVSFVFAGPAPEEDGDIVFFDVDRLHDSLNYKLLEAGLAYPTYYKGLFSDLRDELTAAVINARTIGTDIWAEDVTNKGFDVTGLEDITDKHVILPKLFRRLAEYLENGGAISGFVDFLDRNEESITIISTAHATHFDTVVRVEGNTVYMTEPPENLRFDG